MNHNEIEETIDVDPCAELGDEEDGPNQLVHVSSEPRGNFSYPMTIASVPVMETLPSGTLIIPMDNDLQSTGSDFNLRAYGLAAHLLHAGIPLKWIIQTGKGKDGIDFSANATRVEPSTGSASWQNFKGGPFAIYPGFEAEALVVINNFNSSGNTVNVYELNQSSTVDVYANLVHKPKAALLNNGGNVDIHEDVFIEAGMTEGVHYDLVETAAILDANSCFTYATEPHTDNSDIDVSIVNSVTQFLESGGNFLAQCHGVEAYTVSTNGSLLSTFVDNPGIDGNIQYDNFDHPFAQFQGDLDDEGGAVPSFILSSNPGVRIAYDSDDGTNYKAYVGQISNPLPEGGGYVHYLGGHNYDGNGIEQVNGRRMLLNGLMLPSFRPGGCGLTIGPEANDDQTTLAGCADIVSVDVVSNDQNPLGGTPTVSLVSSGNHGTFTVSGTNIEYVANPGYWPGIDVVTYEICDVNNTCSQATLTVIGDDDIDISGTVYHDVNVNAILDNGETGVDNVTVYLYEDINTDGILDGGDNLVQTTSTGLGGDYLFTVTNSSSTSEVNVTNLAIGSSNDDSFEREDGSNYPNTYEYGTFRYKGFRFPNLNIPDNAIITTANLVLAGYSGGNIPITIRAEDMSAPGSYTSSNSYLSTRTVTTANVVWNLGSFNNNENYTTNDFSSVVQEVVDSHNGCQHLSLIFHNSTGTYVGWNYDDGVSSKYAKLNLTYSIPGDAASYIINVDSSTLPVGTHLSTDSIEVANATSNGDLDCDNDFGYFTPNPSITVLKTSVLSNDVSPAGNSVGDELTYTILVTNTGNTPLFNVTLSDTIVDFFDNELSLQSGPNFQSSTLGSAAGTLLIGESATYTATYELVQSDVDAGGVQNRVTARGTSPQNATVEDNSSVDDVVVQNPVIQVMKSANAPEICIGEVVSYTIDVANDGNVTLQTVTLLDTLRDFYGNILVFDTPPTFVSADQGSAEGTLRVGEIASYTAMYTPDNSDLTSGGLNNRVTAVGTDPSGNGIQDNSGDVDVILNAIPDIAVTGETDLCIGGTTSLTPKSGGTWTSSDDAIATVNNGGIVTALSQGTVNFTFVNSTTSCQATSIDVNVENVIVDVAGPDIICAGFTTQLTPSTGGSWISNDTNVATVTDDGLVTGVAAGSTNFTFTSNSAGCVSESTQSITVEANATVSIVGPTEICVGENSILSTTGAGGTWSVSDPTIALVSPIGEVVGLSPGVVTFNYTNPNGCQSLKSAVLSVHPEVDVVVDFNGSICLTDESELSAIVSGGTSDYTYSWTGPNGFAATTSSIEIVDDGNYNVTVTDSKGCSSNTTAFIYEQYEPFIFTINSEVCEGEDITLSVSGAAGGTFEWDSNADNASTSSVTVTPSYPSTSYTVTVINSIGCSTSATAVIDVIAKPEVSIDGSDSICVGTTTQLLPSSGGLWTASDYEVAVVSNTGLVTGTGTGTVTFLYKDDITGCYSDPTAEVVVNENTTPLITGDDQICIGSNPVLASSIPNGSWYSSNTSVATIDPATGMISPVGQGNATITYEAQSEGCYNTASYNINIHETAELSLNGPSSICEGDLTYVTASTSGSWSSSDESVASISTMGQITGVGAGEATISFTSSAGCVSNLGSPITVVGTPNTTLTGPSDICIDATTTLSPTTGGVWLSSNSTVASVTNDGTVTGNAAGVATFTFIEATHGCVSNNNVTVNVNADPIIAAPSANSLCIGETASITPSSGGAWNSSDPLIASVGNDGTITALAAGTVTFTYTNSTTGCTSAPSSPVTIQPTPTTAFTGPTSICLNGTTTISPSTGGYWYSSDVSLATITNQGLISGLAPGVVKFIFVNGNSGCVSDSSEVLTILEPTIVNITGPSNICVDETTSLSPSSGGSWTSSNVSIASVTNDGIVTAIAPGTVSFIFENSQGCSSAPTADIVVEATPSIEYLGSSELCIGEVTTLSPTTGGVWTSSDPTRATISNDGTVVALSEGTVSFTFTNSSTGCTASTATDLIIQSPPTINLVGGDEICIGQTTSLSPTSGGAWISSDNTIASILPDGTVTGLNAGVVTFTFIESSTGCSSEASAPITILPRPDVEIDGSNSICVGFTTTLMPNTGGTWISDNDAVATVTDAGIVTGISQGIARFTFTTSDGCISNQTAPVIVFSDPDAIIDGPSDLCLEGTVQLLPSSGGTWISNHPSVASIDDSGMVTALTTGFATFTFTDTISGCVSSPSDTIFVHGKPGIGLSGPSEICIGGETSIVPSSGGIWTSLDPTVASIQNDGEIYGLSAGEARFLFTNLTTSCQSDTSSIVTVLGGPEISFNGPNQLCLGDTTYILPSTGGAWESMNTDVATITYEGMIIGIGEGSNQFRFTEFDSGCQSELSEALVVNGPPSVGVVGSSSICINSTTQLSPSSGGVWESLNPSIASVDANGEVSGIAEGTAFFVFTDDVTGCVSDGDLSIEVDGLPEIQLSGSNTLCLGYETYLTPALSGMWTSSNPAIATVSNMGVITAKAPGVVSFKYTDPMTGCSTLAWSDPLTIENCTNHDYNVVLRDEVVLGDLSTNDNAPDALYQSSYATISKPIGGLPQLNINEDGSYSFEANKAGKYIFKVPVCMLPVVIGCEGTLLEINVLEGVYAGGSPVANLEFNTTYNGATPADPGVTVVIEAMANDTCVYAGICNLDPSSLMITKNPSNGTVLINSENKIEYTPDPNFIGLDTIDYTVCLNDGITCMQSQELIIVNHTSALNSVVANDDFFYTMREIGVDGNILMNDDDPEKNNISVLPQGSELNPVVVPEGSYHIASNGYFSFTPDPNFFGTANIVYEVCDNAVESACTEATIHLMVLNDMSMTLRVYLEGALMYNNGEESPSGLPLMRDDLRVSPFTGENYIPLSDPYTFDNDPFINTEDNFVKMGPGMMTKNQFITDSLGVFGVEGQNAIVDWVHVEMRSKEDSTQVIATRSGLVQRDGDVVDLDGVSNLRFQGTNVDSFYVVIKHRSHLGVMSQLVTEDDVLDFTDPDFAVYNFGTQLGDGFDYTGLSRKNTFIDGYSVLWAGDFDSNGKVKFTNPNDDQNVLFLSVLFSSPEFLINYNNTFGYHTGDFDMNSKSKYTNPEDDLNLLFSQVILYPLNTSFLSNFNFIIEQVPE